MGSKNHTNKENSSNLDSPEKYKLSLYNRDKPKTEHYFVSCIFSVNTAEYGLLVKDCKEDFTFLTMVL